MSRKEDGSGQMLWSNRVGRPRTGLGWLGVGEMYSGGCHSFWILSEVTNKL